MNDDPIVSTWKQRLGALLLASLCACGSSPAGSGSERVGNENKTETRLPTVSLKKDGSRLVEPGEANVIESAVFVHGKSSFTSFSAKTVRRAALKYPDAERVAPEAPISLSADDGTGLALESLKATAVIEGPLAFTELHLRFRNPLSRQLEGRFQITLPEGAAVSRLAMRMKDGWREAEVVERMAARRAYEDFLHRKQDPMLLEKEVGNQFRARIFPIPANGTKEIIISYSHELDSKQGYVLPLRGLPAIADLSVDAMVAPERRSLLGYVRKHMSAIKEVPTADFRVQLQSGILALRNRDTVVARLRPELSVAKDRPEALTILFDTSASRAPGFFRQVQRLGTLIEAIALEHGQALPLSVAAFDQEVVPIYAGAAGGFGATELQAILARRPLGASNLSAALSWAGAAQGGNRFAADRLLLIGDAVSTAGSEAVAAQVKALPNSIGRFDVLLVGGIADRAAANRLAIGTRKSDGVVLSERLSDEIIARKLGMATTTLKIGVDGASWVWPTKVSGAQPGDEILVYAGFAGRAPSRVQLQVAGARPVAAMSARAVAGPLLERSAVGAQIARLQSHYALASSTENRAKIAEAIVALSTENRVLSDHTALLVLESESDYARFGISRTALADVLTIDSGGLRAMHRRDLTIFKQVPTGRQSLESAAGRDQKKNKKKQEGVASRSQWERSVDSRARESGLRGGLAKDHEEALELSNAEVRTVGPSRPAPVEQDRSRRRAEAEPIAATSSSDGFGGIAASSSGGAAGGSSIADSPIASKTPALTGKMAAIHSLVSTGNVERGVAQSLKWRNEESGNVMALVALGEALRAAEKPELAARAYGSIIDLFPSRADLRRFAAARLIELGAPGLALGIDSLRRARDQRPDHLSVHRLLAYALVRAGDLRGAFAALEGGLARSYPSGRFAGGLRILREDLGIVGAAWLALEPSAQKDILRRLSVAASGLATEPSTRFVLNWETDANDVDFHIKDNHGGHAFYGARNLASGGELYADVTTGYGPECFAISGRPSAYPYKLQIHYYSRGPMGYGMGQVEIMRHDGKGRLHFDTRPFLVMNDGAYVDLGLVKAPTEEPFTAHKRRAQKTR